jgi:uncharacterized protein
MEPGGSLSVGEGRQPVGEGRQPVGEGRRPVDDPSRLAVAFVHVLRRWGVPVTAGQVPLYAAALAAVGLADQRGAYWAGRATLVHRPEDTGAYDGAFAQFWAGGPRPGRRLPRVVPVAIEVPADDAPDGPDGVGDAAPDRTEVVRYSSIETLRDKDFAAYSAEDFAAAQRLIAGLRAHAATRPSRRHRASPQGRRPDLRRTVRLALRSGGEPVTLAWQAPRTQARRLVLLCDISGSMEPYARALLRYAHAAVVARGRVEVFALGTRLSRLTRQLASRDPDAALAAAARAVPDWSGGTRLGDGLRAFNDEWGVRGMARGAVVVILSDGWDRGDPGVLGEQMGRLHRVAHRLIWVNPLKAAPGYEPLARGMAAALPWVDDFVEGHSLAALERLTMVLASSVGGGPVRPSVRWAGTSVRRHGVDQ